MSWNSKAETLSFKTVGRRILKNLADSSSNLESSAHRALWVYLDKTANIKQTVVIQMIRTLPPTFLLI